MRDLLVFADASEDGLARMQMARTIADAHDAHLEVIVVTPLLAPLYGVEAETLSQLYEQQRRAARAESAHALSALGAFAGPPEKVSIHAREMFFDDVRLRSAVAARTADLAILGQPETLDRSEIDTEIFLGAVLGGGRPCLMLPRWITPHTWGKRAFIAWKGTPEAARAVHGALPFLARAESVRICVANGRGEREGEDERSLSRLVTYLLRHGVKVGDPIVASSWEGPEKLMASEIEAFNADLLVMGAYGHSRLREIVFGGMTAAMARAARIPVLFAH